MWNLLVKEKTRDRGSLGLVAPPARIQQVTLSVVLGLSSEPGAPCGKVCCRESEPSPHWS